MVRHLLPHRRILASFPRPVRTHGRDGTSADLNRRAKPRSGDDAPSANAKTSAAVSSGAVEAPARAAAYTTGPCAAAAAPVVNRTVGAYQLAVTTVQAVKYPTKIERSRPDGRRARRLPLAVADEVAAGDAVAARDVPAELRPAAVRADPSVVLPKA